MSEAVIKTIIHTTEVLIAVGVAAVAIHLFGVDSELGRIGLSTLTVALPKLLRSSNSPIGDYVNER